MRITDALLRQAARTPERLAVVAPGRHLYTYGELRAHMEQHATRLRARPSGADVTVPVHAATPWQYLTQFLGIVHAGHVAVCTPQGARLTRAWTPVSRQVAAQHDIFYLGLTSGSTGMPKGVLRTHASWVESFHLMTRLFGAPQRLLLPGSLAFSAALIAALHALHEGGTVYLHPAPNPATLPALLEREAITHTFLVPTRLRSMLDSCGTRQTALPLTLVTAGARLDRQTRCRFAARFPSARLYAYYGSSEMGFVSYTAPGMDTDKADSVGQLCPGVACELRDARGTPAALGNCGVIYVRSPYQFAGFADQDFVPTADWVTAGDWGQFDQDGFLYLLGRPEEQINIGGGKIFSTEVERVLLAHPAVREVAVIGLPDRLRGQVVGAGVVLQRGARVTPHDLRRWCRERLPSFAIPRRIKMLTALARNAAGKVDRPRILEVLYT